MQKQANDSEEIRKLKEERDRSWLSDILGGAGWGSLYGAGIGGATGGILGAVGGGIGGSAISNGIEQLRQDTISSGGTLSDDENAFADKAKMFAQFGGPIGGGLLGGVGGAFKGIPLGAIIGGLYRTATHDSRRQNAIDRLKELGVESNE